MMFGANVPIPPLLAKRKRDRRGYPIPYITYIDRHKKPQFTVNNGKMVKRCILHNRCGLCGEKMPETVWFVGGPGAALHDSGAFIDPPMHKECATYALQVCPFIAFKPYKGEKDTYVLDGIQQNGLEGTVIKVDEQAEAMKGKPSVFCLVGTTKFRNMGDYNAPRLVRGELVDIEFWKDGKRLSPVKDEELILELINIDLEKVDKIVEEEKAKRTIPYTGPLGGLALNSPGSYILSTIRR